MNHSILNFYLLCLMALSIIFPAYTQTNEPRAVSLTPAQRAKRVMQNNEVQRSELGRDLVIHCNPVRLNGRSLDYRQFSIHSQGKLTVVVGDPDTDSARSIPFQVYVRRKGKIIADFASGFTGESRTEMDLGQILAHSQPGDQLIINPYKEEHWKAKRVLKILE